ncbi:MAG: DUF4199 domain-containing protein [Bacteroidales bacterium]|nr:DUF4199 domain-containing protein [Bacteroidales bacterium]
MRFFRTYQSEIYGPYRTALLRDGLFTGLIMAGIVLFCKLIYYPINTPENLVTDITLLVATFFFTYRYRSSLPEKKVFFKELMMYGLGLGIVAAIVYGLYLLLYGSVIDSEFPSRCLAHFVDGEMSGNASEEDKINTVAVMKGYKLHTWAFIGAFRTAVMSIMVAFISSLLFRTEKDIVKQKNK